MKQEIKIRIRKDLHTRSSKFADYSGMSISGTLTSQLAQFSVDCGGNIPLPSKVEEKISRPAKIPKEGFSSPFTLTVGEELHLFLQKLASYYDLPLPVVIRNIIEHQRANIKLYSDTTSEEDE